MLYGLRDLPWYIKYYSKDDLYDNASSFIVNQDPRDLDLQLSILFGHVNYSSVRNCYTSFITEVALVTDVNLGFN